MEELKLIYEIGTVDHKAAFEKILSTLKDVGLGSEVYYLNDKKFQYTKASKALELHKKKYFSVESESVDFGFNSLAGNQIDKVSFLFKTPVSLKVFDVVVDKLHLLGCFVMAWANDYEYDLWQNAQDPLVYQISGKSTEGLTMKPNGLPPPLNQDIVDTSKNPGRFLFKNGYIEAVAAKMWLSRKLMKTLGCSVDDIIDRAKGVSVTSDRSDYIEINAFESLFNRDDGVQAEIQNALRSVIFKA